MSDLLCAVSQCCEHKARDLLLTAHCVNNIDKCGQSALIHAAVQKNDLVKLLLERGATVDLADNHGCTALIKAAHCGRLRNVLALLHAGASTLTKNKHGKSALNLAEQFGHQHVVLALSDPNIAQELYATHFESDENINQPLSAEEVRHLIKLGVTNSPAEVQILCKSTVSAEVNAPQDAFAGRMEFDQTQPLTGLEIESLIAEHHQTRRPNNVAADCQEYA